VVARMLGEEKKKGKIANKLQFGIDCLDWCSVSFRGGAGSGLLCCCRFGDGIDSQWPMPGYADNSVGHVRSSVPVTVSRTKLRSFGF